MTERQPEAGGEGGNVRRVAAFLGIFFILVSQFLIFSRPIDETILFPPYSWLAVLGVVILVASQLIRPDLFSRRLSAWPVFQGRVFWVLAALFLSGLAAGATANLMLFTRVNYIPVVTIWLLAAGAYCYAFFDVSPDARSVFEWIKKNRTEIIVVAVVTLLAAAFRFYKLGELPRVLDGDEGRIGFMAQSTVSDVLANPKHPYTRALLDCIPSRRKGSGRRGSPKPIPGTMPNPLSPPMGCSFHARCALAVPNCSRIPPELETVGVGHVSRCMRWKDIHL